MPWITAILGAAVSRMLSFAMIFFAWNVAKRIAIVTGFLLASAALFGTMATAVKTLIVAARVAMPASLSAFTYFLPPDINLFLSALVTVRLTHFVWDWTQRNLSHYVNGFGGGQGKYF